MMQNISSFAMPFHVSKTKINKYIGTMTSQTFSFKTNIPMYKQDNKNSFSFKESKLMNHHSNKQKKKEQ